MRIPLDISDDERIIPRFIELLKCENNLMLAALRLIADIDPTRCEVAKQIARHIIHELESKAK